MNRQKNIRWMGAGILALLFACDSPNPFGIKGSGKNDIAQIQPPGVIPPPDDVPPPSDALEQTDTFTQGRNEAVDIAWVIDNSPSMSGEQDDINSNAPIFQSILVNSEADFRLLVITTDANRDSKLKHQCVAKPYLTRATASQFGACAKVGTGGTGKEEGIEGLRRALDEHYVNGALNPGFLRKNVDFHAIFVSDEEDQSMPDTWAGQPNVTTAMIEQLRGELTNGLLDNGTEGRDRDDREAYIPLIQNHLNYFNGRMTAGAHFTAHAIVRRNVSECTSAAEIGKHYVTLAERTGGTRTAICGEWDETMNRIGLEASGIRACFRLTQRPINESAVLEVKLTGNGLPVGGITVPPNGYVYEVDPNQVCFTSAPSEGFGISIRYRIR